MEDKGAPDREVARIAARQHGAISIGQLHAAGLSKNQVVTRCRKGHLHRLHRGVYAVGHISPSPERGWVAALLVGTQGGDGESVAVISHRSAAELWNLLPLTGGPVEVSMRGRRNRRRRSGIRIHRPIRLEAKDIAEHRGIPVTSPSRTLLDLRSVVPDTLLRRAIRQAEVLGLPMEAAVGHDRTRSELERRFLWLCRRNGLPLPGVNVRIANLTVDFCWPEQRLIVETDGYRYHKGRQAFDDDRDRDLRLKGLGFDVMRLSHRQVFDEPAKIVTVLRTLLAGRPR